MFFPEAEELQGAFKDAAEMEGTIVDFSDSGNMARAYAVIEVILRQNVVVPVHKLIPKGSPG